MFYIIDANNLAGKLNLLGEADFDFKLIEIIRLYKPDKKHFFFLVFDSADPMGDKKKIDDRLTAIYTPKDNYYRNADDKILELAGGVAELSSGYSEFSFNHGKADKIIVVTDDLEIKEKITDLNREKNLNIKLKRSSEFAEKLRKYYEEEIIDNEDELSKDEEDEINREFMDIWK